LIAVGESCNGLPVQQEENIFPPKNHPATIAEDCLIKSRLFVISFDQNLQN
jgi:hypothetical protein